MANPSGNQASGDHRSSCTLQPVEPPKECTGPSLKSVPAVSFGAPPNDRMLITASVGNFTARNRSAGSSSLTTSPPTVVQLGGILGSPPWSGQLRCSCVLIQPPPGRANHASPPGSVGTRLVSDAYAACGEAASTLHAMALLQDLQAKALRDLHEGGHDPEVLKELRTATNLALRAMKVTAWSLGSAMSTMVIQECQNCLYLVDMRDAD